MQKQEEANAEAIKAAKLDQEKEQSEMLENMEPNSSLNEISNADRIEFMENPFIRPVKLPLVSKKIVPHVWWCSSSNCVFHNKLIIIF